MRKNDESKCQDSENRPVSPPCRTTRDHRAAPIRISPRKRQDRVDDTSENRNLPKKPRYNDDDQISSCSEDEAQNLREASDTAFDDSVS